MWTRLKFPLCLLLICIQSGLFSARIASGQTRRAPTPRAQGGDVTTGLQLRLSEGTAVLDNQPVAPAAPAAAPQQAAPTQPVPASQKGPAKK